MGVQDGLSEARTEGGCINARLGINSPGLVCSMGTGLHGASHIASAHNYSWENED